MGDAGAGLELVRSCRRTHPLRGHEKVALLTTQLIMESICFLFRAVWLRSHSPSIVYGRRDQTIANNPQASSPGGEKERKMSENITETRICSLNRPIDTLSPTSHAVRAQPRRSYDMLPPTSLQGRCI